MKEKEPGDDLFASFVCNLNLSGLTGTKIILWLVAITVVSYAFGFAIFGLSGGLSPCPEPVASPFNRMAFTSVNTSSFPLEGASSGEVRIILGAGELTVQGGAQPDNLMETTVYSGSSMMQPDYAVSRSGSAQRVAMTETGHKKKDWVFAHSPGSWENLWIARLSPHVPLTLDVKLGAGDCTLMLGTLDLSGLSLDTGAGETTVDLSGYRGGVFSGRINQGVGDLTVRVPRESNTRIVINQGIGDIDDNGFVTAGKEYTTPGFNRENPAIGILIDQGVGDIRIEAV
jgi:hypothetical protein